MVGVFLVGGGEGEIGTRGRKGLLLLQLVAGWLRGRKGRIVIQQRTREGVVCPFVACEIKKGGGGEKSDCARQTKLCF